MVWLGGVMCKLTVAAFLPLQMAENHLNLPTQVQFFTLTSFISSSTSFTTAFGGISLWQICATTKGKSPLNSTLTTLHYRYIRGAPSPVFPHHHSSSSSSTGQMDGWTFFVHLQQREAPDLQILPRHSSASAPSILTS